MKNLNHKIVRKVAFALLMLMTFPLKAQNDDVIKFLGIPVDGSKSEMISNLEKKGFVYDSKNDCLSGEFNGNNVFLLIGTNKDKVYRIHVVDSKTYNEAQIKIRFNELVRQFENNRKYGDHYDVEQYISDDESISYQMSVRKKRYTARFYQRDVEGMNSFMSNINDAEYETMHDQVHNITIQLCNQLGVEYPKDKLTLLSDEQVFEYEKIYIKGLLVLLEEQKASYRMVWFEIFEKYGEYYIGIYYDNLYNKANGEDL